MITQKEKDSVARRFNIPSNDVLWYNWGTCYDRILVATKESADKVSQAVKDDQVNGGWYHGVYLGGQTLVKNGDGEASYEVMC